MALSSPGIGSGLDVQGIVQKLVAVERQPLAKVDARVTELKTHISAYGTLKSAVAAFRDAVSGLADAAKFRVNAASTTESGVLFASAGPDAARGSHTIEVKRLAEAHRQATTEAWASADEVVTSLGNTLLFTTATGGFSVDIAGKTLTGIRDAINGAAGNSAVRATLIRGDDGHRLMLHANATGRAGYVEVTDETGNEAKLQTLNVDRNGEAVANGVTSFQGRLGLKKFQETSTYFDESSGTSKELNGIAAGMLHINGVAIDEVEAAAGSRTTGEVMEALAGRINAKSAQHGVTARVVLNAWSRYYIELTEASGREFTIETKAGSTSLDNGGIDEFFHRGTMTVPAGHVHNPTRAYRLSDEPVRAGVEHPTGILAAGSVKINDVSIDAADFTADQTARGAMSALVDAINAKSDLHGVDAGLETLGDYTAIRLLDRAQGRVKVTLNAPLDPWTWRFLHGHKEPTNNPAFTRNYPGSIEAVSSFDLADLDAEILIDGRFSRTSSSNTLTDVLEHVTLELEGVGETVVNVDRDVAAIEASAQAIAKSYSDLVATLGKLGGDALRAERSTLGTLERELRAVLNERVDVDAAFSNAFELGFSTRKRGDLSLDTTTFGKALARDYDGLARLFADPDKGIAKRLFELADRYLDTGGLFDGRSTGLSRQVREAESTRAAMEQRMKLVEERLLKQYNNLDLLVSRLQGTNSALTSQLDAITGFYRQNRA